MCLLCAQEPDIAGCDTMRHVLVGGEALPPALAARFCKCWPHAHLHNAYGPTETTVDVTGKRIHAPGPCPAIQVLMAVVRSGLKHSQCVTWRLLASRV